MLTYGIPPIYTYLVQYIHSLYIHSDTYMDDRAGLRGYVQFNKYIYIPVHTKNVEKKGLVP